MSEETDKINHQNHAAETAVMSSKQNDDLKSKESAVEGTGEHKTNPNILESTKVKEKQGETEKKDATHGDEEEEAEEEEEEMAPEDVFGSLADFSTEMFNVFGAPAEPLTEGERQPRPLSPEPHDLNSTFRLLQELMTYDDNDPDVTYGAGSLDDSGRMAIASHLLAAVVTTLDGQHLRRLATRLVSDTCLWISRLFRYFDSTAYFHEDIREGVVRVCRMLLHTRYPKYGIDGYEALYARPPVIYTSSAVRPGLPQHIVAMLGIGSGCIRVVPYNTVVGSSVAMDTAALDRMMAEDLSAQKKPFLVIANAGGGLVGGVDNVSRIQELCHKHEAWLHVEGHALAALTLPNTPNLPAKVGDSMTLPLSTWLGIPALPYVTLYRACESAAVHAAGLTSLSLQVRLGCLPLWTTLQNLGQNGIISRIQHAFELSQHLQRHLATIPRIRLLSPSPPAGSATITIQDLVTKPISTAQLLETVCGSVVFQYVEETNTGERNPEYYDNLNSWLGQVVRRDVGSVPLELVQLETAGLVLRWSPLEGPGTYHVSLADVGRLVQSLHHQIDILNATVKQREKFSNLVDSSTNLQLAEIPIWAGLGGVRYIPDIWAEHDELPEAAREDINVLNSHLVTQLQATDSAFSLGEGSDGMNCVRFGMVTADTDISELLSLVLNTGRDIETSSKFIDQMTEVVKKGIEAATEDLKRENDERLWQEGILRHVPIVGSVYNWLSPPPPPGIKGRTLDLTAGVLESTENIYRYHMQIRHGTAPTRSDTKLPPAPSVVTSVTPSTASPTHSRTSSSTSAPLPAHSRQGSSDHKITTTTSRVSESSSASHHPSVEKKITQDSNNISLSNNIIPAIPLPSTTTTTSTDDLPLSDSVSGPLSAAAKPVPGPVEVSS